jgi:hypothetical protein
MDEDVAIESPHPVHSESSAGGRQAAPDSPVPPESEERETPAPRRSGGGKPPTPEELVQTGVSFLSGLAKTLSDPVETQKLVSSLTAKDETTGQTYLKIPVENETAVADALQVLGGLFRAFTTQKQ